MQSLTRSYMNAAGQVIAVDRYTNLAGLTYSTAATLGAEGTNFLRTRYAYNNQGLVDRVQNPAGTITISAYDGRSRVTGTWVGTNDSTTNGFKWRPGNAGPASNMVQVAAYEYDNGGTGNGLLTRVTEFPGGAASPRTTQYAYGWRGRLVATKAGVSSMRTIGNPGNPGNPASSPAGLGAVGYDFQISPTEVTNAQYAAFLTATGAPNSTFNASQAITQSGATYTANIGFENKPVVNLSWFSAARFVNWLATNGASTENGAYTIVGNATSGAIPSRTPGASHWLPDVNEWHKAAFYTGNGSTYTLYQTNSNSIPGPTANFATANQANYNSAASGLTDVGGYTATTSAYGLFDMLGNVTEYLDTINPVNGNQAARVGGNWSMPSASLNLVIGNSAILYGGGGATNQNNLGFRIAARAEPDLDAVNRPFTYIDYDNLGRITQTRVFDGDRVTIADANLDGIPDAPAAHLLHGSQVSLYDSQDRVYRTQELFVDQTTGSVGTPRLSTDVFYDRRGNVAAVYAPDAPVTQSRYDGAGRLTASYTLGNVPLAQWGHATSLNSALVLEQTEYGYDRAGNVILTTNRQRFHDASATALGPLGTPTAGIRARVSYAATYYDAADRLTASVNVGTNGGVAYVRPATIPDRSDTTLVTTYAYGPSGRVQDVTDPRGITARTLSDALGRTTASIANYTGGVAGAQTDVTTLFSFDSAGRLASRTAVQPTGRPSQVTGYVYGVSPATGSGIASNDILAPARYPAPLPRSGLGLRFSHRTRHLYVQRPRRTDELYGPRRHDPHLHLRRRGPPDGRRRHGVGHGRGRRRPPDRVGLRHARAPDDGHVVQWRDGHERGREPGHPGL